MLRTSTHYLQYTIMFYFLSDKNYIEKQFFFKNFGVDIPSRYAWYIWGQFSPHPSPVPTHFHIGTRVQRVCNACARIHTLIPVPILFLATHVYMTFWINWPKRVPVCPHPNIIFGLNTIDRRECPAIPNRVHASSCIMLKYRWPTKWLSPRPRVLLHTLGIIRVVCNMKCGRSTE